MKQSKKTRKELYTQVLCIEGIVDVTLLNNVFDEIGRDPKIYKVQINRTTIMVRILTVGEWSVYKDIVYKVLKSLIEKHIKFDDNITISDFKLNSTEHDLKPRESTTNYFELFSPSTTNMSYLDRYKQYILQSNIDWLSIDEIVLKTVIPIISKLEGIPSFLISKGLDINKYITLEGCKTFDYEIDDINTEIAIVESFCIVYCKYMSNKKTTSKYKQAFTAIKAGYAPCIEHHIQSNDFIRYKDRKVSIVDFSNAMNKYEGQEQNSKNTIAFLGKLPGTSYKLFDKIKEDYMLESENINYNIVDEIFEKFGFEGSKEDFILFHVNCVKAQNTIGKDEVENNPLTLTLAGYQGVGKTSIVRTLYTFSETLKNQGGQSTIAYISKKRLTGTDDNLVYRIQKGLGGLIQYEDDMIPDLKTELSNKSMTTGDTLVVREFHEGDAKPVPRFESLVQSTNHVKDCIHDETGNRRYIMIVVKAHNNKTTIDDFFHKDESKKHKEFQSFIQWQYTNNMKYQEDNNERLENERVIKNNNYHTVGQEKLNSFLDKVCLIDREKDKDDNFIYESYFCDRDSLRDLFPLNVKDDEFYQLLTKLINLGKISYIVKGYTQYYSVIPKTNKTLLNKYYADIIGKDHDETNENIIDDFI